MRLDHVTIRSDDPDAVRDFFTDVLGLRVGDRPPFEFPGYWLYGADGGQALVHLVRHDPDREYVSGAGGPLNDADTGAVDHIAFRGDDMDALVARLEELGVDFTARTQTGGGARQVFVRGPHNIVVEINFPAAG